MVETSEESLVKSAKALDSLLTKKYGENYYGITQDRKLPPVKFISTGCHSLDYVLGGGIPEGRILELGLLTM